MLASVGLPGTSGFVGEFLVLFGSFQANPWVSLLATSGVVLGATYMLFLYRRVVFGELKHDDLKDILDLDKREVIIFVPLVLVVIWMGVYPHSFLGLMDASVENLLQNVKTAICAKAGACLPAK